MTDETKFDPAWKHGWDIVLPDNCLEEVRLLAIDAPGVWPIVVMDRSGGIWKFSADGIGSVNCYSLVNRPAPKASGTSWVVVYKSTKTTSASIYSGEEAEERARKDAAHFLRINYKVLAIKRIDWTEGERL